MKHTLDLKESPQIEGVDANVYNTIIGVDEAGYGCLAGECFIVAAVCKSSPATDGIIINDSKKLSKEERENSFTVLKKNALFSKKSVSVKDIDDPNKSIFHLRFKRAEEAVLDLIRENPELKAPYLVLMDGNKPIYFKDESIKSLSIVGGDGKIALIAVASIFAKSFKDEEMECLQKMHTGFTFSQHQGYGTKKHYEEILKNGLTDAHRKTFCRKIQKI